MGDFKFKKKFGQNFLKDKKIIKNIVDCANIDEDSLVIEVGPGKGILTEQLSKKAKRVLCYEIDLDLENILTEKFDNSNVQVIYDDFLNRNISEDIKNYNCKKIYFVSNVPYYITTPILLKLIESNVDIEKIVIMVQKEVGERFSAKTGTKNYGSITVFLNYYYDIKNEFNVNRNEFEPVPNVDSVVISFTKRQNKYKVNNQKKFFELVRDSFKYKRKNIKNNLKNYDLEIINNILLENNLSLSSRAEQIPIDVFIKISNSL